MLVLLPLRKGECIGWVMFAEYRTVSLCALSPSLLDECCSVSLLVSSSFTAAKLHHIAGQFLLPTGEHSRSCLASTCLWYLLSPFFFFCLSSPSCRQPLARLRQVRQMMSSSLVATSLSSRTTTSLRSKLAPRQQPVACWLWTPSVYLLDS